VAVVVAVQAVEAAVQVAQTQVQVAQMLQGQTQPLIVAAAAAVQAVRQMVATVVAVK
jgi:hypothetical protein